MQVLMAIKNEILIYLEERPKEPPCLSERLSSLIQNILGKSAFMSDCFVANMYSIEFSREVTNIGIWKFSWNNHKTNNNYNRWSRFWEYNVRLL